MMDPNKQGVSPICRNIDCNGTSSLSLRGPSPINLLPSRNRRLFRKRKEHERGIDKEPTLSPVELDVTCGRGKHRWNSKGNRRYRAIIMENVIRYQEARTKCGKSSIVREVVQQVQENMAKFVKRDPKTKLWKELTPTETRTKVAHALRDHIRIVLSCSSLGVSNANLHESESLESASHEGDEERESYHMKGLSLPNHIKNNVTTEQLSSSAHDEMPPWAALPSNSSVVLRAASLDIKIRHLKEQRKEEPVAVIMAPSSWQPARVSFEKHLEDDHEFSVGGAYLDLPNGVHQQPCQSRLCDNSLQQDHREIDGMSGVTQLSGFTPLGHAISPWVRRCTLHSGGVSNPNTGGAYFQVGNNQNVHSFDVCSCRNIPGAITMAMAPCDERKAPRTFPQLELNTFVSPSLSTNGPACGQLSIAIGSHHQANDAMSIISSVANLLPMHMEGYPVATKPNMAAAKNFSAVSSQLIGGSPMLVGSHNVSRATGGFDLVDPGIFPWLKNYVNEANTPSIAGRIVNEEDDDSSIFFNQGFPAL